MTAEERHESNVTIQRNTQSRPARYVNGVRLSDEEVANITKSREDQSKKRKMKLLESSSSSAISSTYSILLSAMLRERCIE